MKSLSLAALFFTLLLASSRGQALDSLISDPNLWQTPRAGFVDQHGDLGFYWLSNSRDRAESRAKNVTLFSQPVCETDAEFQGDKLSALTISVYDRGDAGNIPRDQMNALMGGLVNAITAMTHVPRQWLGQEGGGAVKVWAFQWLAPATKYLLEYSYTREVAAPFTPFRAEFIRLRLTPAEKPKSFMDAALAAAAPGAQASFDGPSHVKKDPSGDVRIDSVPMVDQGEKGYCVVATTERVMRYYGVPVDENELAELANTSASAGTSNATMFDALEKLANRLRVRTRTLEVMDVRQILDLISQYNLIARRTPGTAQIPDQGYELNLDRIYAQMKPDLLIKARTHNQADVDRFLHMVQDRIDQGVPVLWSVMLGIVPENPPVRGVGGHMRLIIGYNASTNEILYTDSWGPGHELKRMSTGDAWTITTELNIIQPLD